MNKKKVTKEEPTNSEMLAEILGAMSVFSNDVDKRFVSLENRMGNLEGRVGGIEGNMQGLEPRLSRIEATMVTKDYLDDKLADLRGDLVVIMRKEDKKLHVLLEEMVRAGTLSPRVAKRILAMEPFPQIVL